MTSSLVSNTSDKYPFASDKNAGTGDYWPYTKLAYGTDGSGYTPVDATNRVPSNPSNFTKTFQEGFDVYPNGNWTQVIASGDIIRADGNTGGAAYLVISKDPLTANTVTTYTCNSSVTLPVEISVGAHTSQRTLGQEFSIELIDPNNSIPAYTDVAISSISQTTTTLSVTTSSNHNLVIGSCISVYGVNDSRMNYTALVVATIPSPTSFTCTGGPTGTIPSVTAGPFVTGYITKRPRLGGSASGISQIFENNTVTTAAIYTRANSGEAQTTGTLTSPHGITTGSSASVQLVSSPYSYNFNPTTDYRFLAAPDRVQFIYSTLDAASAPTYVVGRSQVVPDATKSYKLRFRCTNNQSMCVPVAKIVTLQKSGSTTATITTDVPHGLTTADLVTIYGASDQTNFANAVTATAVASVINSTQFTIAFGVSATATAFGGTVVRVNGGNLPSSSGYGGVSAVSATLATAADGTQALTLTGNTSWSGLLIGDYVNVHGLRSVPATGADLGCDGAYVVRNVSTTLLELGAIGSTTLPANFGATACGGMVIKRTDLRLSFARFFDYDRLRIEGISQATNDASRSMSFTAQGGSIGTVSAVTSANLGIPGIVADVASAAITTTTTTGTLIPSSGNSYSVNIPVTAVSGTNPTMDVQIQESPDTATNWYAVYDFPRITATGSYSSPVLPLTGNRIRYVQTLTGTTPSFTRTINRLQTTFDAPYIRQLFDRTVTLTSLSNTTAALFAQQLTKNVQLSINVGAITTTAPALQLQVSDDGQTSWTSIGSPLTAVANSTVTVPINNVTAQFYRAIVTTAGVGVTAGYVMIRAF